MVSYSLLAALLASAAITRQQAVLEPADGLNYYCAWLDTSDSAPGANDGDRPTKFINRMGFSPSVYQYAQDLPAVPHEFPIEQVWATNTDAHILLTVYPQPTPWNLTDAQINTLVEQVAKINRQGRGVFLRFAPEMNGNWFVWGQRPVDFVNLWRRVTNAIRAVAPRTAMVWGPNTGSGYPYTNNVIANAVNLAAMDTNNDGLITEADDPYGPWYPGDEYVDWVGLSIYHFGTTYPWEDNSLPAEGKFERLMNDGNFYQRYSVQKRKPFMLSEGAAAFHTNTPLGPGAGEFNIKRAWWRQYATNAAFLQRHPNLKLQCIFEFYKPEETFSNGEVSLRDFRIANKSEIYTAYVNDLATVKDKYIFAKCVPGAECAAPKGPMAAGNRFSGNGNQGYNGPATVNPPISGVPSGDERFARSPTAGVVLAGMIVSITAWLFFQP